MIFLVLLKIVTSDFSSFTINRINTCAIEFDWLESETKVISSTRRSNGEIKDHVIEHAA